MQAPGEKPVSLSWRRSWNRGSHTLGGGSSQTALLGAASLTQVSRHLTPRRAGRDARVLLRKGQIHTQANLHWGGERAPQICDGCRGAKWFTRMRRRLTSLGGVFRVLLHGERSGKWSESTHSARTHTRGKSDEDLLLWVSFDFRIQRVLLSRFVLLRESWSNYAPAARLFAFGWIYILIPQVQLQRSQRGNFWCGANYSAWAERCSSSSLPLPVCQLNRNVSRVEKREIEKIQSANWRVKFHSVIQSFAWRPRVYLVVQIDANKSGVNKIKLD